MPAVAFALAAMLLVVAMVSAMAMVAMPVMAAVRFEDNFDSLSLTHL